MHKKILKEIGQRLDDEKRDSPRTYQQVEAELFEILERQRGTDAANAQIKKFSDPNTRRLSK